MNSTLKLIEKEICTLITDQLDKVGILYRLFSRTKDNNSIQEKILRKDKQRDPYRKGHKLMQDIVGVRIVTYFKDDIDIIYSILKRKLNFIDEEIDEFDLTVFKPKRTNIICRLNNEQNQYFKEMQSASANGHYDLIDNTFELQLRTILSEGWHEIDHSLRYKCKEDWANHAENERMLNGIYANLETNDIALKSLFNELAYKHYKDGNWEGLLRNKFRLKFRLEPMNNDLKDLFEKNNEIGKRIFRLDRENLINQISSLEIPLPISFNNIVYVLNAFYIHNKEIYKLTPNTLLKEFKIELR